MAYNKQFDHIYKREGKKYKSFCQNPDCGAIVTVFDHDPKKRPSYCLKCRGNISFSISRWQEIKLKTKKKYKFYCQNNDCGTVVTVFEKNKIPPVCLRCGWNTPHVYGPDDAPSAPDIPDDGPPPPYEPSAPPNLPPLPPYIEEEPPDYDVPPPSASDMRGIDSPTGTASTYEMSAEILKKRQGAKYYAFCQNSNCGAVVTVFQPWERPSHCLKCNATVDYSSRWQELKLKAKTKYKFYCQNPDCAAVVTVFNKKDVPPYCLKCGWNPPHVYGPGDAPSAPDIPDGPPPPYGPDDAPSAPDMSIPVYPQPLDLLSSKTSYKSSRGRIPTEQLESKLQSRKEIYTPPGTFLDGLGITLLLTFENKPGKKHSESKGKSFEIAEGFLKSVKISGNKVSSPKHKARGKVENIKLNAHSYGFSCELAFSVSCSDSSNDDKIFPLFITNDLIKTELSIKSLRAKFHKTKANPLIFHGIVTDKVILSEKILLDSKKKSVYYRSYKITFCDSLSVLWKQHFPTELLLKKTYEDLIKLYKGNLKIKFDKGREAGDAFWGKKYPILALCLGFNQNQTDYNDSEIKNRKGEIGTSFYDFFMWLIDKNNGVFFYDFTKDEYTIALKKTKCEKRKTKNIEYNCVEKYVIVFPQTQRNTVNVLSSSVSKNVTNKSKEIDLKKKQNIEPLRRDYASCISVKKDFDDRVKLETSRFKIQEPKLIIYYKLFPEVDARIGDFIKIFEEGKFGKKLYTNKKTYRITDINLEINSTEKEGDFHSGESDGYLTYNILMKTTAELDTETFVNFPSYKVPQYPFYVQGSIVSTKGKSEKGKPAEETYELYTDEGKKASSSKGKDSGGSSALNYKVKVLMWDASKTKKEGGGKSGGKGGAEGESKGMDILIPAEPGFMSPHFFFPLVKDTVVLVAFSFHYAWIARILTYRQNQQVQSDQSAQPNRIVSGKSSKEFVSIDYDNTGEDSTTVFKITQKLTKDKKDFTQELKFHQNGFSITSGKGKKKEKI